MFKKSYLFISAFTHFIDQAGNCIPNFNKILIPYSHK